MSVIASRRGSPNSHGSRSVVDSLETALSEFSSILNDEERRRLLQIKAIPDASAALVFTAELDRSKANQKGRSIGSRAYTMLQSIQQFSGVVETFVSSNPDIAALVWGSVKLTLLLSVNVTSYFESLADLFMDLNHLCPQFDQYQLLYPDSQDLQWSICKFHAAIVQLCKRAIEISRQSWVKNMKKALVSLREELRPQTEEIKKCGGQVKDAIALAKAKADRREQEFQELERKNASRMRKQLLKFGNESKTELESAKEWRLQRDERMLRKQNRDLLDSLSTYDFRKNFHQARKKRHVDTTQWLLANPEFLQWKTSDASSVLWLTGKIGSGKTVLTTSLIDHLHCERTSADEIITFIMPRFDDPTSLSAGSVLRSIIRQTFTPGNLTPRSKRLLSSVESAITSLKTLYELLNYCVSVREYSVFYIIIDALDEFEKEERIALLRALSYALSSASSKVKLCLVGRTSIFRDIHYHFSTVQHISADCQEVEVDISMYTQGTIAAKLEKEELCVRDPTLADEIVKVLTEEANGMFLWVDFQISEICEQLTDQDIREVLHSLPKNLKETFNRTLKKIARHGYFKTVHSVFQWVAVAKRALTLDELAEALSFGPGQKYSIPEKRVNGFERVTSWCEGFVQLDEELKTIQFAHHSVLEYLLSQSRDLSLQVFNIDLEESDHYAGEICLTYLNLNDFKTALIKKKPATVPSTLPMHIIGETLKIPKDSGISSIIRNLNLNNLSGENTEQILVNDANSSDSRMARLQFGHPFLEYASQNWLLHTRNFRMDRSVMWKTWMSMVLGHNSLAALPWSQSQYLERSPIVYEWIDLHDHLAAFQHNSWLRGLNVEERKLLLRRFATSSHPRLLKFLVERVENREELTEGLISASKQGLPDMVACFLEANAMADDPYQDHIAIIEAARNGRLKVVEQLIAAGANLNKKSGHKYAVFEAMQNFHNDVLEALLFAGASPNIQARGLPVIVAASQKGNISAVQKLLDAGANVDAISEAGWTSLMVAAEEGYLQGIKLLLAAKARVDIKSNDGRTDAISLAKERKAQYRRTKDECLANSGEILQILRAARKLVDSGIPSVQKEVNTG